MIFNIIIVVLLMIAYIVEGFHDNTLKQLYTKKTQLPAVKMWHKFDALFHTIIIAGFAILLANGSIAVFICIAYQLAALRQITLNTTLNILADKPLWYLGETSKIDSILQPYEKVVYIVQICMILILTVILNKFEHIFY